MPRSAACGQQDAHQAARPLLPEATGGGADGAAAGAQGGPVSTIGGGGTAIAGAAGALGSEPLVSVLQQLAAALESLAMALRPGAGTSAGVVGGGGQAAPPGGGCGCPAAARPVQLAGAHGAPEAPAAGRKQQRGKGGSRDARSGADKVKGAGAAGPVDRTRIAKWLKGDLDGLNPQLLDRLAQLGERMGTRLDVISGHRSHQEQEVLYRKHLAGTGNLAAKPGSSNHESGNAADVNIRGVSLQKDAKAARIAAELGLAFPVRGEPWHVELRR